MVSVVVKFFYLEKNQHRILEIVVYAWLVPVDHSAQPFLVLCIPHCAVNNKMQQLPNHPSPVDRHPEIGNLGVYIPLQLLLVLLTVVEPVDRLV